ncbi:Casparian strip membrane protein domain, partial [Dillenia turbinata]
MKAVSVELGDASKSSMQSNRGVAIIATLGSAIAMGTTNEALPFFTRLALGRCLMIFQLSRKLFLILITFHGLPFMHLGISNMFLVQGQALLALLAAGSSAAAAIVYLAHKGNARINWFTICQRFNSSCERVSGSLI